MYDTHTHVRTCMYVKKVADIEIFVV